MKKVLYIILTLVFSFREARAIENNCPNPNIADVFYADGTCSANYIPSKNAIGIIYWLGAKKKGGLIMALDESTDMNWNSAVNYCKSYSKQGVTGWKLPEIGELIPMGLESAYGIRNDKYPILNAQLATISGTRQLTDGYLWSGSYYDDTGVVLISGPLYGNIYNDAKGYNNFARCVLAF